MSLDGAIHLLRRLRTDAGADKYPAITLHHAPHKPLLLLSVIDLIEQTSLSNALVTLSPELIDLFVRYWELVMPRDRTPKLALPFFHLKNDGVWQLVAQPGQEARLVAVRQIAGMAQLRSLVLGAKLDDGLFHLLLEPNSRDEMRMTLIKTYFASEVYSILIEQSQRNQAISAYSEKLLQQVQQIPSSPMGLASSDELPAAVRDPGFRRAVVKAYDHRCVCCGIRLLTLDGRSAAKAAHIKPWSLSHNDDPRNGLCLCGLCHWAFDVGMLGITMRYRVKVSSQMQSIGNIGGHLATLDQRPIFEPQASIFNPDTEALDWHLENVFLGQ